MPGLVFTIGGGKVSVEVDRYHNRSGFDRFQSCFKIAVIGGIVADIAVVPCPQLRQQIVRVAPLEKWFPEILDKLLVVRGPESLINSCTIEWFGKPPAGVDRRKRSQAIDRGTIVKAVRIDGIQLQSAAQ